MELIYRITDAFQERWYDLKARWFRKRDDKGQWTPANIVSAVVVLVIVIVVLIVVLAILKHYGLI